MKPPTKEVEEIMKILEQFFLVTDSIHDNTIREFAEIIVKKFSTKK